MHMVASNTWTADMVRELPDDGNRYETVHGALLVSPGPRALHERIQRRLCTAIDVYLGREPVGEVFVSRAELSWGPDILVQPDLVVIAIDEANTLDWSRMQHALLVVEILSESSRKADRVAKRMLYQSVGVPTYWIVDADAGVVEVWTPRATAMVVEDATLRWHPDGARTALEIPLGQLFAR